MIERKTAAIASLAQIEAMGDARINRFSLDPDILSFDLDSILLCYPATERPSRLCELCTWAGITDRNKLSSFRRAVERYDRDVSGSQEEMSRGLLSRMNTYFRQRMAQVAPGSEAERDLKQQFADIVDRCIDASRNCVDQFLSQLQGMMLDVVADGYAASQGGRILQRIKLRAGHELCKYRSNLIRTICVRQNPDEAHMADLERLVVAKIASRVGMRGGIFVAGARYGGMISNATMKANRAYDAFMHEYAPLQFLANELRTYHGQARKLRNDLFLWANNHFGLDDEVDAGAATSTAATAATTSDVPQNLNMNRRMSENFDDLPVNEGGNLTRPAVLYLLNAANLVTANA